MIYFQVQTNSGKVIAGNMEAFYRRSDFENNRNFFESKGQSKLKGSEEVLEDIRVWVVAEDEDDLLKSTKLFRKTLSIYKRVALDVWKYHKNLLDAHAHTLTTIQGQIRQRIEGFALDEKFFGLSYTDSLKKITELVSTDQEGAADLICYVHKRIADMRAHLLGVEVVHSGAQYEVKISIVSLKRAILNQCTPFLEEFEKLKVNLHFFFGDECDVSVDKNMFSLVMYNFFSNAVKYVKSNSEIRLNYSDQRKSLDISMISLKMERDEIVSLFNETVRGRHAGTIPGKGIGLFVLQQALILMGKQKMFIDPNYENHSSEDGKIYIENHFQFSF